MNASRRRLLNRIQLVTDALCLFFGYKLADVLWLDLFKRDINMASDDGLSLMMAVGGILLMYLMGLYGTQHRRFRRQCLMVMEALVLEAFAAVIVLFTYHLDNFSRGVLALFCAVSFLLICLKRFLLIRLILRYVPQDSLTRHIVVVGTGRLAREYQENLILQNPTLLDEKRVIDGFIGEDSTIPGYLGSIGQLDRLLENPKLDEVVAALDINEIHHLTNVIRSCEHYGTKISIIPFYNDVMPANPSIELVGTSKLVNLRSNPLDSAGKAALKRGFDIVGSALLILLLSPLLLITAVGTKLSSPGPILFRQERVGMHKKRFMMYKFRSMRVNAAETTGWTTNTDPRKTKFGAFIRKYSIDELPQLFNVLKGDMSLIGPRPEIPYYVEQFKDTVPLYMVKHQVRPGMTGWAQVNGYRGDTSIPLRIEHDVWYIENWSVRLDIRILIRTACGGFMNQEKAK